MERAKPSPRTHYPLIINPICAGFPSPAQDLLEGSLDLNELLILHQDATFFMRVEGDSMIGAGIHEGDLIIVDRALTPQGGSVVVAEYRGELTLKRLDLSEGRVRLRPENRGYRVIEVGEFEEINIWGVVSYVIHRV